MNRYLDEARRLLLAGQFAAAAVQCRKSIAMQKDPAVARGMLADCHFNLGVFHDQVSGLADEAEVEFARALQADPRHADAANNLGALLLKKGQGDAAAAHFRAALAENPGDARYLANLARSLVQTDHLDEASAALLALAGRDPGNAGAYLLCEAMLVSEITSDPGYPARVRERIRNKLSGLESRNFGLDDPLAFPTTYFPLSYHGESNADILARLAAIHLRWNPSLGEIAPHVQGWKRPAGKARIGIASRFLRNHSIGNTSRGLVEHLDRERFEVTVVRLEPSRDDDTSRAIDRAADRVVTLPAGPLGRAREALAALGLDILFYQDVGMEPLSYYLSMARLAPVQLTSFGHPDTTGIPNMDYYFSSDACEPPGAEREYTEQLVRGAGVLSYYYRPARPDPVPPRESFGLRSDERIYLCPQTLFKLQPVMDSLFEKIAQRDPGATIVLIDAGHRSLRPAIERRLRAHSARAAACVRFVPAMPFAKYLGLVANADVILDTVHFNGYNTTLEAFALGVPVVTWPRSLQRGRHGLGMYRSMGFTDLIATDEEDYANKAVRVATDAHFRAACVERIAERCGVLYEDKAFIESCEDALEAMMREREAALR